MNFLRLLARLLFWFALVAVIAAGILCVPAVQTWIAQTVLERHPESGISVGEISVGWGTLKIADLKVATKNGAVFNAPIVEAHFPLKSLWRRRVEFESVAAKGWTLDLSGFVEKKAATASDPHPEILEGLSTDPVKGALKSSDEEVSRTNPPDEFHGLLNQFDLPWDVAIDAVDLEGDVIAAQDGGKTKARAHLNATGGSLGAGREGKLDVKYSGTATYFDDGLQILEISGASQWKIVMATPRALKNIYISSRVTVKGGVLARDFSATVTTSVNRDAGTESYTFDLVRDQRHLGTIDGKFAEGAHRLDGSWQLDLEDSDWTAFASGHAWPTLAAKGRGDFSRDFGSAGLALNGVVDLSAKKLGNFFPELASADELTLAAKFQASRVADLLRVQQLQIKVAATAPVGVIESTQTFDLNLVTGALMMSDAKKDVLAVSLQNFPLAWISGAAAGLAFPNGNLAGELKLRAEQGSFVLRAESPLVAHNVTVQYEGKTLASQLDLSAPFAVKKNSEGWQLECAPLSVRRGGKKLGSLELKATKPTTPNAPVKAIGNWTADLAALHDLPEAPRFGWEDAATAGGDFSVESGNPAKWAGQILITGRDAADSLATKFTADVGTNKVIAFRAPIQISRGARHSEVLAEGTWSRGGKGNWIDLRVGGKEARVEELKVLFSPFLSSGKNSLGAGATAEAGGSLSSASARDQSPFWGDLTGKLNLGFDQLHVGDSDVKGVRGTLAIDAKSVRVQTGLYSLPEQGLARVDGTLTFDAAAARPYRLQLTLADTEVDGATLFPAPKEEHDPIFHGKFSVGSSVNGSGLNLDDLTHHTEQEYQLKSTSGIVRFLKTNVADTMKQPVTPVGDALGSVGSLVGKIFGRNDVEKGEIHLGKNAEGVIDFSYRVAELGYQDITIAAARTADGAVLLKSIAMTAGDLRVGGSGQIDYGQTLKLSARPLKAELRFAVKGKLAELLASSGLLVGGKDADGFISFAKTVHVGGTLDQIDLQGWHDLLAEGANQPDPPKTNAAKK